MIKIQHPEFELWGTGIHARSGVSCADCHMPYVRRGSVKISDHWIRSPLQHVHACRTCHPFDEKELRDRVAEIQDKTAGLLRRTEEAILSAMDAIAEAKQGGTEEKSLGEAMNLHRSAQLRWDFISSENSTGFQSPQEAARVLAEGIDMARRAELSAYARKARR